jgi:AAA domain
MLMAPTGLGKTNLVLAMAVAVTTKQNFLHWQVPRLARVLYIDGEMSERLMRSRLEDAIRRAGGTVPKTLHILSRLADFPDLPPLNTRAGQDYVDRFIAGIGGTDLILCDNIQALLTGDMKDEAVWQPMLPWIRELTRRAIGQVWIHYTNSEGLSYGTKTREWQLDTVAVMEAVQRPETDIAFALRFTKARERAPHNRADFDPVIVTLADDRWAFERGGYTPRKYTATDRAFELLQEAIAREGVVPVASEHIPANTPCVTEGLWRAIARKARSRKAPRTRYEWRSSVQPSD